MKAWATMTVMFAHCAIIAVTHPVLCVLEAVIAVYAEEADILKVL